jgi:hypothetical protein
LEALSHPDYHQPRDFVGLQKAMASFELPSQEELVNRCAMEACIIRDQIISNHPQPPLDAPETLDLILVLKISERKLD